MSVPRLAAMELGKLLRRGRTYIGPLGMLAILIPTVIGLKYGGIEGEFTGFIGAGNISVIGSPVNASFIARVVLPPTVFLFMPLFVSLVAGDQISGEAADGTLRTLLARPVDRFRLLLAKYLVSLIYAVCLPLLLAVAAYLLGWAVFGQGGLVSYGGGIKYFGMAEGIQRLLIAYASAAVYLLSVTSLAFLFSVFVTSSLFPVGATLICLLTSGSMGEIPYFHAVKPYLFTSYADLFQRAFDIPLDPQVFARGAAALLIYCAACFGIAAFVFVRKDILT